MSSYSREVERLAGSLFDLLEAAVRRREPMSKADLDALGHLEPALERLAVLVSRALHMPKTPAGEPPGRPAFMMSLANEMAVLRGGAHAVAPALRSNPYGGSSETRQASYAAPPDPRPAAPVQPGHARPAVHAPPPPPRVPSPSTPRPGIGRPQRSVSDDAASEANDFTDWVRREILASAGGASSSTPATPAPVARPTLSLDELLPTLLRDVAFGVSIQGTTGSMPMKALFQLIELGSKSGCLHVRTPSEHARFVFDAGRIVAATTDEPPKGGRLGDLLIGFGYVDQASLDHALTRMRELGVPLGEALLRDGAVSMQQLEQALSKQLLDHFRRFEREALVAYAFVSSARSVHDGKLRMSPRELLLEAARVTDEQKRAD